MLERKKRLAAILLAAAVCVTEVSAGSLAVSAEEGQGQIGVESLERQADEEEKEFGDYIYKVLEDGTVEISGYNGSDESVSIPSQIDGKDVTRIGNGVFMYSGLEDITIPNSVTEIGGEAFSNSGLKNITIPNSVKSIGDSAFSDCNDLNSVTLAEGLEIIEESAFSRCHSLSSIDIPESVTSIGENAFANCDLLSSITVPKGVESIGTRAFGGSRDVEINVDSENSHYASVDGCLCNKEKTKILECDKQLAGGILPAGITSIGKYAFSDSEMRDITLSDELISIEDCAFYCSALTSITIPKGVMSIGEGAFVGDTEVYVDPDNSHYVSVDGCLYNKEKTEILSHPRDVTELALPEGLTSIGDYTFCLCWDLTSVTLPKSLKNIGNYAFEGCSNLNSITIPESVTEIGRDAFNANVTIYGKEGSYALEYAFENNFAFMDTDADLTGMDIQNGVLYKYTGTAEDVVIPNGVKSIEASAFDDCSSVKSITIPKSVGKIGGGVDSLRDIHVFCGCSSLEELNVDAANEVYASQDGILYNKDKTKLIRCPRGKSGALTIPEGVTEIGVESFHECGSLTSISIPQSVTQIQMVYFKELIIDGLYQNPFEGCNSLKELKVAADNKDYVSENGILYNKGKTSLIRYLPEPSGTVSIPANVKYIGAGAFSGYTKLTDIIIPQGATSIGYRAFYGCSGLKSVVIPESVTSIAPLVFRNDDHLTDLTIYGKAGSYAESYAKGAGIKFSSDGTAVGNKTISDKNVAINPSSYVYDGKAKKPAVTVKDGNATLTEGKDYTVAYKDNINAGNATVILTGAGAYTGTVNKGFTIQKASQGLNCTKTFQKAYGDKSFSLNAKRKAGNGKLSYASSDNKAVKVSNKGKVTIQGIGCAVITIKAAGTSNYNEETVKVTVLVSPKKQTLQAPKTLAGRKLKVSWKKDTKATGYEVQYSTDKNFKNKKVTKTKVVKSNKTISVTVGKLAKGKKYYVRVRSYKTAKVAGKKQKLYGKWSSAKRSGKIKK